MIFIFSIQINQGLRCKQYLLHCLHFYLFYILYISVINATRYSHFTYMFSTCFGRTWPLSGVYHNAKLLDCTVCHSFTSKLKTKQGNPDQFQLKAVKSLSSCGYRLLIRMTCLCNLSCGIGVFVLSCSSWMQM